MPSTKFMRAYYEKRFLPGDMGPSRRSPESFRPFLEWIDVRPGDKLIDVACGTGSLLKQATTISGAWGLDISINAISVAHKLVENARLTIGDMQHLPYKKGFFDIVMNIGALEHVTDMRRAIQEMMRISKPNARICIVVPNAAFFLWRIRGRGGTEQSSAKESLASLDDWSALLQRMGLKIIQVKRDPGPNISLDYGLVNFIKGILRRMALTLASLLPITSTYQFAFICQKEKSSAIYG